jgi:hypothetical protein
MDFQQFQLLSKLEQKNYSYFLKVLKINCFSISEYQFFKFLQKNDF